MNLPLFLLATLALNLTPGPDMLYVIAQSVRQGRSAGVMSALGIGGGTLVHMAALALGLSTLLLSVPVAYDAVKYIGAAYLAYLGVRTLLSRRSTLGEDVDVEEPPDGVKKSKAVDYWGIFRQGAITNVLNPKVALFFIAFIPQFVDPAMGPVGWQVLLLGLIFNTSGILVNSGVALIAGTLGDKLRTSKRVSTIQRWFTGTVFIGLAVRLVWPAEK
ncbi:MAG: LysE family translocator [Chloroflexia bacterium]